MFLFRSNKRQLYRLPLASSPIPTVHNVKCNQAFLEGTLLGCEELQKYDRARVFLDEDYTAADKFTALGNLYFIHESIEDVSIWDFVDT
ncbi:hypothetical protein KUTeg_005649 [Tegillarca granosa]|uniref:Uncharacterized protein n=1 Tax=Tegillarca granosa TaxID=220873 RepID=A0ABQ9FPU7_TEGGR|nr:hypothetical protein KUTeg_005649 [Tegillarca granosa]